MLPPTSAQPLRTRPAPKSKVDSVMLRTLSDAPYTFPSGAKRAWRIRAAFPFDQIEPVPKGINGADVIQRVHNKNGHCCGTIVWESKRTKGWSEGWIQKLKDDLRLVKGDLAIIVSEALP